MVKIFVVFEDTVEGVGVAGEVFGDEDEPLEGGEEVFAFGAFVEDLVEAGEGGLGEAELVEGAAKFVVGFGAQGHGGVVFGLDDLVEEEAGLEVVVGLGEALGIGHKLERLGGLINRVGFGAAAVAKVKAVAGGGGCVGVAATAEVKAVAAASFVAAVRVCGWGVAAAEVEAVLGLCGGTELDQQEGAQGHQEDPAGLDHSSLLGGSSAAYK